MFLMVLLSFFCFFFFDAATPCANVVKPRPD